jgi:hypothetical protein
MPYTEGGGEGAPAHAEADAAPNSPDDAVERLSQHQEAHAAHHNIRPYHILVISERAVWLHRQWHKHMSQASMSPSQPFAPLKNMIFEHVTCRT